MWNPETIRQINNAQAQTGDYRTAATEAGIVLADRTGQPLKPTSQPLSEQKPTETVPQK